MGNTDGERAGGVWSVPGMKVAVLSCVLVMVVAVAQTVATIMGYQAAGPADTPKMILPIAVDVLVLAMAVAELFAGGLRKALVVFSALFLSWHVVAILADFFARGGPDVEAIFGIGLGPGVTVIYQVETTSLLVIALVLLTTPGRWNSGLRRRTPGFRVADPPFPAAVNYPPLVREGKRVMADAPPPSYRPTHL
jgi:hypothetical protein